MRMRFLLAATALTMAACNGEIYVRDGVTDGDTFYLADRALVDDDPVLQSWVSYSLAVSACQLMNGGENPARASSFDCEVQARQVMLDTWREKQAIDRSVADPYLDDLEIIDNAGFLGEHVARHFANQGWDIPGDLEIRAYRDWARDVIPGHDAETRSGGDENSARPAIGLIEDELE